MKQTRIKPYPLRIAEDLRQWLQNKANEAKRSLNSEIELRLEKSRNAENETAK